MAVHLEVVLFVLVGRLGPTGAGVGAGDRRIMAFTILAVSLITSVAEVADVADAAAAGGAAAAAATALTRFATKTIIYHPCISDAETT